MLGLGRRKPAAPPEAAPALPPRVPPAPESLLRRLEFRVLKRLDGFLFGDYTGLFYGPSLDLAEVREYQPGDEVRRMDWNVTARSGRLHVRQYREERELTAWILVDASASMNFGTRRVTKRDLALEFAGLAARIVTRHGDKVGALVLGSAGAVTVPARAGRNQALEVIRAVARAGQGVPAAAVLASGLETIERTLRRRGLVFVVSDFLEQGPEPSWSRPLGRLAARHEVIAVRASDPAERVLPDVGGLRFRDPETGEEVWVETSDRRVRAAHAKLVSDRDAAVKRALRAAGVDLLELDTARDIVAPLLRFAAVRRGRRRGPA